MLSDDGSPDLIGTRLIYPWDKLSSHGVVRLAKYGSGLSFKALIPRACMLTYVITHPVKTGRPLEIS